MTPAEILRGARRILTDPKRWVQGYYACDVHGYRCEVGHHNAIRFCLAGAIGLYGHPGHKADAVSIAVPVLKRVLGIDPIDSLTKWNDAPERTHTEVLAALDAAISLAEREATP